MTSASTARGALAPWLLAAVLVASTWVLYAPATDHAFLNYDDGVYVTENPHVTAGLTKESMRRALVHPHRGNYHPVTMLSHMLDVELGGLDPVVHHRTNVALHAADVLLLFLLLRRLTGSLWRAALVAALFAVHPLNVQSVAWVAERKNLLSTTFWLLALLAYLPYMRRPGPLRYLGVVVPFVLGLASKPMVVTLPLTLLLIDQAAARGWTLPRRPRETGAGRLLVEKTPLLALSGVAGLVAFWAQRGQGAMHDLESHTLVERLGNAVTGYLWYVEKTFLPLDLAVFYPLPAGGPGVVRLLVGLLLLALVSVAIFGVGRRVPYLSTGWAWYLLTLLPVIGLVQVGAQAYADRYAYVPVIGLFLAAVWGVAFWCAGRAPSWRRLASGVALLAVALFALASTRELLHWRDSISLFRRATEVSPRSHVAQTNLATALVDEGRLAEALTHFRAAAEVAPALASARMNLANALALSGTLEEALVQYDEARRLDTRDPRIPYNFGQALIDAGRPERAEEQLREALRLDPGYVEARRTLADLLARQGRREEAERLLREGANR
jgi:hypothetical protein